MSAPKLIGYPPAPTNGGRFEDAPAKIGDWVWQPKVNEWRGICHVPTLTVWSQYGDLSTVEQQGKIAVALEELRPFAQVLEWLDIGIFENRHDLMKGSIVVFDWIPNRLKLPHWDRRIILRQWFRTMPQSTVGILGASTGVYLVSEWYMNVPMIWEGLQQMNAALGKPFYEGLVAKRRDAIYPLQHRAKGKTHLWVKHRFDQ